MLIAGSVERSLGVFRYANAARESGLIKTSRTRLLYIATHLSSHYALFRVDAA